MHTKLKLDDYLACGECDLLLEPINVKDGFRAKCPRCGYVLYKPTKKSVNKTLIFSLIGLIIFIPASVLPIFYLNLLGEERGVSVIEGLRVLYQQGYWLVASVVLLTSLLIPLMCLSNLFFLSFCLKYKYHSFYLAMIFRQYLQLSGWGMLEVYFLGAMVAAVKLYEMKGLSIGLGFYFFCALLMSVISLTILIDKKTFWHLIEQQNEL